MATNPSPAYTSSLTLEPIQFTPQEIEELIHQRKLCGWNYELSKIQSWQAKSQRGEKYMFWITIADPSSPHSADASSSTSVTTSSVSSTASLSTSFTTDQPTIRAGHVSLASVADPPNPLLARPDKSLLTISTFFIQPQYRSLGLGRYVMDLLERMATRPPYGSENCKAIAIDTLSKKYFDRSRPEWKVLEKELTGQWSNHTWYERRGYVSFKEEPRYQDPVPEELGGGTIVIDAVFLRKELRP